MHPIGELTRGECERLLRAGVFGRVVFPGEGCIEVLPVNYTTVDEVLLVRTEQGTLLQRYANGAALAFEIDYVNYERWHGWSVVARGIGEVLADGDLTERERAAAGPPRWVQRAESVWVRLRWDEVSGRRVGVAWDYMSELPVRRIG